MTELGLNTGINSAQIPASGPRKLKLAPLVLIATKWRSAFPQMPKNELKRDFQRMWLTELLGSDKRSKHPAKTERPWQRRSFLAQWFSRTLVSQEWCVKISYLLLGISRKFLFLFLSGGPCGLTHEHTMWYWEPCAPCRTCSHTCSRRLELQSSTAHRLSQWLQKIKTASHPETQSSHTDTSQP